MSLETVLAAHLQEQSQVLEAFLASDPDALIVRLPEGTDLDTLHVNQLASAVAQASNQYATLARLAGIARANAKVAKGRYERKLKMGTAEGKNQAERDAKVFAGAAEDHTTYTYADALASLIETLLDAARIASESSRKLFDRQGDMFRGEQRATAQSRYYS